MAVAEATCRYRAPSRFDDEFAVAVSLAHLGTTSMVTAMPVDRDAIRLAEGEMRHVVVERPAHGPARLTASCPPDGLVLPEGRGLPPRVGGAARSQRDAGRGPGLAT